jgi:uncharacterized protein (DUF58 family)
MTRAGTERLVTAAVTTIVGIVVAVVVGEPEAALFVTPWAVLLVLGLSRSGPPPSAAAVTVDEDRFLVGDDIEVKTTIDEAAGTVRIRCLPSDGFWSQTSAGRRPSAGVHDLLARARSEVSAPLRAEQWGVHDVGRVELSVTEPYGLFRWTGVVGGPRFVRVHPTQSQLQNLLSPRLVRRVAGFHESRAVGRGVEYADLRPFTSGDSLREINWRVTARTGDLWVSQRHPDRATDVVLFVDSFVESGHDVRTVFGLAIEGAVALAESHLGAADRVGLVELGGTLRWLSPATGAHQLQRISDALLSTGLHSHVADRNLPILLSKALPPRSFVVALTPLLDNRFIEALHILAGHGHDVGVIEVEEPTRPLGVAGRIWEAERQMTRDKLAEHGVAVARWTRGEHLDLPLLELERRRRRVVRDGVR